MTATTQKIILASLVGSVRAFAPSTMKTSSASALGMSSTTSNERPLYDPLNLYNENSEERINGRIRLEPKVKAVKPVLDPLNLYSDNAEVDTNVDMSEALPFVSRPITLNRELAGDAGFDPFNFADSEEKLLWLRESELKHSRIAMLAAAGWPLSELFDKPLAHMLHLKPLLGFGDRVPSILNGGLGKVNPVYWIAVLGMASAIEFQALNKENDDDKSSIWDPLSMFPESESGKYRMELAEIKNGRLAMMAIVGFAVQEFVSKIGVVNETPIFFHSITDYVQYFPQGNQMM